jgi:hypothetical protein
MSSEIPVSTADNTDIKCENVVACETVDEVQEKAPGSSILTPNADSEAKVDRQTLQAVLQFLKKYNLKVSSYLV